MYKKLYDAFEGWSNLVDGVNDTLERFSARLDAIEKAVDEIYAVRTKQDVPLEVLLNEEPFITVHNETFDEGHIQATEGFNSCFAEEKLTYSQPLESGKQYYLDRGLIGVVALKILEGEGVFKLCYSSNGECTTELPFTVVHSEKYVLFQRGMIVREDVFWEVKEEEGNVRYMLAMSSFGHTTIKEVVK